MTVRLLYFAWVREQIGKASEELTLEAPATLAALMDRLATLGEGHALALSQRDRLRAAINKDFATPDSLVQPGDEVAIFPPVTGG